jgi:DNA-binding transcriptional ArsR family regulator
VDFSVVSRHLARLSSDGVLVSEKRGRTVWYEPRWDELSTKFRALADAIDEWRPDETGGCCDSGCCG